VRIVTTDAFPLLLISAWNDSGGAFLHRLFDGHPDCFVYPFELQLGTDSLHDGFARWFHAKYRWPDLPVDLATRPAEELFAGFIDDEVKGYLGARESSKFRSFDLELSLEEWRAQFRRLLPAAGGSREAVIAAYVRALFAAWQNRRSSGRERLYVGHCPVIVVDADRILGDCPGARLIHVVRRPTSGFVDFRRRVPEMEIGSYCRKWALVNMLGFYFGQKYPERVATVRLERLLEERAATLRGLCEWLGLAYDPVLEVPTWNGEPLARLPPFGGVPVASVEHERECEQSLSAEERAVIETETGSVMRLYR
jgi:hypothetical protein